MAPPSAATFIRFQLPLISTEANVSCWTTSIVARDELKPASHWSYISDRRVWLKGTEFAVCPKPRIDRQPLKLIPRKTYFTGSKVWSTINSQAPQAQPHFQSGISVLQEGGPWRRVWNSHNRTGTQRACKAPCQWSPPFWQSLHALSSSRNLLHYPQSTIVRLQFRDKDPMCLFCLQISISRSYRNSRKNHGVDEGMRRILDTS